MTLTSQAKWPPPPPPPLTTTVPLDKRDRKNLRPRRNLACQTSLGGCVALPLNNPPHHRLLVSFCVYYLFPCHTRYISDRTPPVTLCPAWSKSSQTYLSPTLRIEYDVCFPRHVAQPVPTGFFDLYADARSWQMATEVMDTLDGCVRDTTLFFLCFFSRFVFFSFCSASSFVLALRNRPCTVTTHQCCLAPLPLSPLPKIRPRRKGREKVGKNDYTPRNATMSLRLHP